MKYSKLFILSILGALLAFNGAVNAQLQITEMMVDATNNNDWEWIEVYNPSGAAIPLSGYLLDDLGDASPVGDPANITTGSVPAGGVAVIYDAATLDDARFRAAWPVPAGVPVIGATFFPTLNNGGDAIGLWPNRAAYDADTMDTDGLGDIEVVQFNNAAVSLDFSMGFTIPDKVSIEWNGTGNWQDSANWAATQAGVNGGVTSTQTFLSGMNQLNSTDDFANPGAAPAGTTNNLVITEMMFNPRSDEPQWEWMEVYNGTGATIDFAATPYVFDEEGGTALTEANLTQGSIADGEVAVLFNGGAITAADMETAWGAGVNYIPVDGWQSLNNGATGDVAGIWDALDADYAADKAGAAGGGASVWPNAVASANYEGAIDDGMTSFSLTSLSADPTDPANWVPSTTGSNANPVFSGGAPIDHDGGEVGSPGSFGTVTPPGLLCDLDSDGDCDTADIEMIIDAGGGTVAADLITWLGQASASNNPYLGGAKTFKVGDVNLDGSIGSDDLGQLLNKFNSTTDLDWIDGNLNGDGVVDSADLGLLLNNFNFTSAAAAAVPEPGSVSLLIVALVGLTMASRRKTF